MGGGEQIPSLDSAGVALYTHNLHFWELMIGHRESAICASLPAALLPVDATHVAAVTNQHPS
jgi:hypothetical protein